MNFTPLSVRSMQSRFVMMVGTVLAGGCLAAGTAASGQTTTPRPNDVYAINSGGAAISGWTADAGYLLGSAYSNTTRQVSLVNLPQDDAPAAVYQDGREGDHFSYIFKALQANTVYAVTLHFAELYFSAANQRQFNVAINGTPELTNFDIVAAAGGPFRATTMTFYVAADSKGVLTINFTRGAYDHPLVNAVEIATRVGG